MFKPLRVVDDVFSIFIWVSDSVVDGVEPTGVIPLTSLTLAFFVSTGLTQEGSSY